MNIKLLLTLACSSLLFTPTIPMQQFLKSDKGIVTTLGIIGTGLCIGTVSIQQAFMKKRDEMLNDFVTHIHTHHQQEVEANNNFPSVQVIQTAPHACPYGGSYTLAAGNEVKSDVCCGIPVELSGYCDYRYNIPGQQRPSISYIFTPINPHLAFEGITKFAGTKNL